MDLWELISELCRRVVEEQNVYLEILIMDNQCRIQLMPLDDYEEEEDD